MSIGPRLRFDVLRRDQFTCRYCGRKAPHVTLVVDHVHPVSAGGANTKDNLVAACEPCNQGKGSRKLLEPKRPAPLALQLESVLWFLGSNRRWFREKAATIGHPDWTPIRLLDLREYVALQRSERTIRAALGQAVAAVEPRRFRITAAPAH